MKIWLPLLDIWTCIRHPRSVVAAVHAYRAECDDRDAQQQRRIAALEKERDDLQSENRQLRASHGALAFAVRMPSGWH